MKWSIQTIILILIALGILIKIGIIRIPGTESFLNYAQAVPITSGNDGPYIQRQPDYKSNTGVTQADLVFNPYNPLEAGKGPLYNYPNLILPASVIGGGARRGGVLGGSEMVIPTVSIPKDISNTNIAPVNILTRYDPANPLQKPHQVGVIYKVFGNSNDIYPLYGAKREFNGSRWDYFTIVQKAGGMSIKVPVRTKNYNDRLGNNDPVWLDHCDEEHRVTIYEDGLQYYPYV